jgi:hypothetical protein
LNEAEIACIYYFRTFGADGEHEDNIYGYNRTIGGDGIGKGHKCSEEKREKTRKQTAGKNNPRYIFIDKNILSWLIEQDLKEKEIAKYLKIDTRTLQKRSKEYNLLIKKAPYIRPKIKHIDIILLKKFIKMGFNKKRLLKQFNISIKLLKRILNENNLIVSREPNWRKGMVGKYPAWNKGLTKETDARVAKYINNKLKNRLK